MSSNKKEDTKILLFQIRDDAAIAQHELKVVAENSGLAKTNFASVNVVSDTRPSLAELKGYDAVMIGGAGGYSVLDDQPFIPYLEDVVRFVRENDIPFLGICFGFQIAVQALGGAIIHDKEHMETGTFLMRRRKVSDSDPLIGDLPYEFSAACGRQDRATVLPVGAVNDITSERTPYNSLTFPGSKFFGVQFHPELWRKEDNVLRLRHYKEKYSLSDDEFQKQLALFHDAPESQFIIRNFVEKVVLASPQIHTDGVTDINRSQI
ncbi:MAG: hypothetical protein A3C90_02675 [Candidatus Magasanikbacteria bacterium RIFCSPHIGHO2_02_FULL_51_14]|uniref:Glutamine amidotransferase domain-containing protein n=1 Tax=Candidatus Magasanikbacteria bacterium RIFCSPHIGHO2_02_FULL_51_14 TaxID=1798683 RepID=A0A1F6MEG8_9BACT|nr:MAG: hypothetical protein A3C90_02675 [Candidatus Magasanikbacteria bacterium RIFCSPHIGHO2_02_FULL_51_14]